MSNGVTDPRKRAKAAKVKTPRISMRRQLRRARAKMNGRGGMLRRMAELPVVCLYCGKRFGRTREDLAHHIVNCDDHPANRFALILGALSMAFDIPADEHPRRAALRAVELAAVLLRQSGGETQLSTAIRLERFIKRITDVLKTFVE